jgi:hypothetical protein
MTRTGILECASTRWVSLPRNAPRRPPRPCEASDSRRQASARISRPAVPARRLEHRVVLRHEIDRTKKDIHRRRDAALQPQLQAARSDLQVGRKHLHTAGHVRRALQSPDMHCCHSGLTILRGAVNVKRQAFSRASFRAAGRSRRRGSRAARARCSRPDRAGGRRSCGASLRRRAPSSCAGRARRRAASPIA